MSPEHCREWLDRKPLNSVLYVCFGSMNTISASQMMQLGMALEGARLYRDTRRRAEQERLTGQITARMRESLDIDTVLQSAVREIGEALDIAEVEVRMMSPERVNSLPALSGSNGDNQGEDEETL